MWRCVERKGVVPCSASMKTNLAMENLQLLKIHNHQAVPGRVDVVKARGQMKARARSSLDKPNQIFVNTNANMTEDAKALLATPETIRRDLRRTRAAHHPVEPQTLRDLEILGQWALTVGINPEALVLHDSGRDSNERIIIFAKNGHVQKLAECDKWCMDGNFAVAPPLFLQLYVILGRVAGSFVPLVYALLERKTLATYEEMFQVLAHHNCFPTTAIIDFEIAVQLAATSIFGLGFEIQYCFYHLTNSTYRKVQALGLVPLYRDNEEFRLFVGQLDALAFLPPDQVRDVMAHLQRVMPAAAADLVQYFDETYVSGRVQRIPRPPGPGPIGFRYSHIPPVFAIEKWNMHQVTLNNEPRTNNNAEGWNNRFSSLVGEDHPGVYKLIETIQAECERVET